MLVLRFPNSCQERKQDSRRWNRGERHPCHGPTSENRPGTKRMSYTLAPAHVAVAAAMVMAAVGLAQNLGALRALVTDGIQKGHMALHARQTALAAGVALEDVSQVAEGLVKRGEIRIDAAKALWQQIRTPNTND